jgi:hypothetical protein
MERRPIKTTDVATTVSSANGGAPPTLAQVGAEIEAAQAAGELSLQDKFTLFEKKLKAALSDSSATSSALGKILAETDNAIEAAQQEALAARERGLDFCAVADARIAREAIEDSEFFVSRLLTQRPRLEALLQARQQAEARDKYLARYEQLKIEGAALGAELVEYPDLVGPLVEVFGRLRAFREQCHRLHATDPGGLPHLRDPELVARRFDGFSADTPSLLDSVHLHDWRTGTEVWPPRQPSFAADFAQSFSIPSVGPAWCDPAVQERRRAELAAAQERMARAHAEMSKAQEENQNRQLRADWEARQNGRG